VETGAPDPGSARNETPLERYDRNLTELTGELRVALPGVQVLFAFLLVAPFNARFGRTTTFERHLYLTALLCTLLASILLIAPTVIHRLEFRHGNKEWVVRVGNRLALAGLAVLAVAMTCAVALVTHFLFGATTAIVTTVLAASGFTVLWLVVPLTARRRFDRARRGAEGARPGGGS
jgi:hypothetical protein